MTPVEQDAKDFTNEALVNLEHGLTVTRMERMRGEQSPLFCKLQEGHMKGELRAAERILSMIEVDTSLTRLDIMADLHLFIKEVNNRLHDKNGTGEKVDVDLFTNKYLTSMSSYFLQ